MSQIKIIKILLIIPISMALVSCAGNMEGYTGSTLDKLDTQLTVDEGVSQKTLTLMDEVNEAEKETEPAYKEIEKQEKKIKTINILSFLLALPFKTSTEAAPREKLKNPITSVLDKLVKVVDKAYSIDDKIREKLELIVVDLDPEIPSHAEALEKIDNLHIKLDSFDAKLDKSVVRMMNVADSIINKIKLKRATYLPIDPRILLLNIGKGYFTDFKKELQLYLDETEIN